MLQLTAIQLQYINELVNLSVKGINHYYKQGEDEGLDAEQIGKIMYNVSLGNPVFILTLAEQLKNLEVESDHVNIEVIPND